MISVNFRGLLFLSQFFGYIVKAKVYHQKKKEENKKKKAGVGVAPSIPPDSGSLGYNHLSSVSYFCLPSYF